ncbi:MFS transporter [Thalassobaculum sp.]|uniref:MFS transporter n=1 Tax=Thalassobaculum sp. TaxID=2022740 RepID=UPI0032EF736E
MTHPFIALLHDRNVRVLWGGLAMSAIGTELYRVGAVWLAVGLAGGDASLLIAAQAAATLAVSLGGGAVADLVPRAVLIVWLNVMSAAVCALTVAAALTFGLTLPLLMTASVALAAFAALTTPALISGVPLLVPEPERLRAANGLFDASTRSAQVVGPFIAAGWLAIGPAVHLLTANAISFLASAGAVAAVGRQLVDRAPRTGNPTTLLARLGLGVSSACRCPGAWWILSATSVRSAGMALGFTVGVPVLLSQEVGFSAGGLASVALVFGGSAAGELIGNAVVVTWKLRNPWRMLFTGYAVIGLGLMLLPVPLLFLDETAAVPAMVLLAFISGLGGALAGVQMLTFFGSRLASDAFGAVLRLRQAMVIGAAMVATAAGPWLFEVLGVPGTIAGCGAAATGIAVFVLVAGRQPAASG